MRPASDHAHTHSTTRLRETADALRTVLRDHGVDLTGLSVEQDRISLGDIGVTTADRLARLLGAPVQPVVRNLEEWPEARQVMRRLGAAFRAATGGGFLDLYFHHDCVRCDSDAALTLGPITPAQAQRLTSRLSGEASLPAAPVIDTHVLLRDGDKLLLSQRGGPYGYGRWHMPSGKLDRGEALSAGAARELYEETGVRVEPGQLRLVHVVHHRQSEEVERIGFFFEATEWEGEPVNREPGKCLELRWFGVHELPDDVIE